MGGPSSSFPRGENYINSNDSNQIYSGDRVNYTSKKFSRGGGSANSTFRKQYQYHSRDGKGIDITDSAEDNKTKKVAKIQPPPPVGREHYPSLNGELGDSSPISITKTGIEEELGKKTSNSAGAYAAALLKDAPPIHPSTGSMKRPSTTKSVARTPSLAKGLKKKPESHVTFSSGKTTVVTVGTDDSSSDDKSSLSSKPESENFTLTTTGTPSVGTSSNTAWGGGLSFADVVKK